MIRHLFPFSHTFSFLLETSGSVPTLHDPSHFSAHVPQTEHTPECVCMFLNLYSLYVCARLRLCVCVCVCVCVSLFCGRMWSALVEVNQRNPRVQRSNSIAFIDQATFSASVPSLCSFRLSPSLSFLQLFLCAALFVVYFLFYTSATDLHLIAVFLFTFWVPLSNEASFIKGLTFFLN